MENLIKVDARGLSCPQPVVLTMNALKTPASRYEITVDNHTAEQNTLNHQHLQSHRNQQ